MSSRVPSSLMYDIKNLIEKFYLTLVSVEKFMQGKPYSNAETSSI
jgi:hypothetical protein